MKTINLSMAFAFCLLIIYSCSTSKTEVACNYDVPYKKVYVLDTLGISTTESCGKLLTRFKSLRNGPVIEDGDTLKNKSGKPIQECDTCVAIYNPIIVDYGGAQFLLSEPDFPKNPKDIEWFFQPRSHLYCSDRQFNITHSNMHLSRKVTDDVSIYKFDNLPRCFIVLFVDMQLFLDRENEVIKSRKVQKKLYEMRKCYFRVAYPVY